ncbi:MAG: hypothetical protein U0X41_02705 [Chitinophagales bacterium]
MKKNTLSLLFSLAIISVKAQVEVYKTYEDYKNNIYTHYADYKKSKVAASGADYIFIDDKSAEVSINTNTIWGFKYKDVLFRIFKLSAYAPAAAVINVGKVVYYENGDAYLKSLKNNREDVKLNLGLSYFFSATLESEVYGGNKMGKFFAAKENEKYDELFKMLIEDISYKFLPKKFLEDEAQMKEYRYKWTSGREVADVRKIILKYEGIEKLGTATIEWKYFQQ